MPAYRIGYGEDAHRLAPGRPLILAGLSIPEAPLGAVAHSDGDAVLHAVADALLSGLALGDIGQYFPDTEERWQDLDSRRIVEKALELVQERHYQLVNLALVVTLDQPKLGPRRGQLVQSLAQLLHLSPEVVGLSFKTSEGLAPEHIQVRVTVLLRRVSGG